LLGGEAFFSERVKVTLGEWILGVTCRSGECCQNLVPNTDKRPVYNIPFCKSKQLKMLELYKKL